MQPRIKKMIGIILFLPALLIYFGLVVTISDYVPRNLLVQLVFYIIAGTIWAFPLKPLIMWMNKQPEDNQSEE